jgi:hypothetical protein
MFSGFLNIYFTYHTSLKLVSFLHNDNQVNVDWERKELNFIKFSVFVDFALIYVNLVERQRGKSKQNKNEQMLFSHSGFPNEADGEWW